MNEYGDEFSNAVAGELRAQRARVKITFDQLTERTGMAKTTVLNYLNGRRDIPIPAFIALCEALSVSPGDIFDAAEKAVEHDAR